MSALKAPTDCVLYARALNAYVDGELSADYTAELEAHVVKCTECFEQVEQHRALRLSLRRTCASTASASFRERMAAMVAAETTRSASAEHQGSSASFPREARLPINRCNLPAVVLGGLTYQSHPSPLLIDGVAELHADLFRRLNAALPAELADVFRDYLTVHFRLERP